MAQMGDQMAQMGDQAQDDIPESARFFDGGGAAAAGPSDPGKKPAKKWEEMIGSGSSSSLSVSPEMSPYPIRFEHPLSRQPEKMAGRREMKRLAGTGGYSLDDVIHHRQDDARLHVLTRHAMEKKYPAPWDEDEYFLHRRHYKHKLRGLDRMDHLEYLDNILGGMSVDDIPSTSALKYIESTKEGGQLKRDQMEEKRARIAAMNAEFDKGKKMRISVKNPFVLDLDFANLSLS